MKKSDNTLPPLLRRSAPSSKYYEGEATQRQAFDANRICEMISILSRAVRNHPSTVPDGEMTTALRMQEYLEKRKQMQHIKELRKFLTKRYKRRRLAPKFLKMLSTFFSF
jgi:hypothetical protein